MESPTEQGREYAWDTLRILHLPSHLTHSQRERLLKKYGAVTVRTVNKSDKYAITFAKYPSEDAATRAFLQLHQLRVRGRRLSVEYAKMSPSQLSENNGHQPENPKDADGDQTRVGPSFRTFLKKLNSWALGPILTQPPPPNILYKYSPPTTDTLSRIAIQMLKEPVFYCQVLHLMNRMNLPPPFKELEAEFPFLRDMYNVERYDHILGQAVARNAETDEKCLDGNEETETESELESDEGDLRPKEIIPVKRKLPQSKKRLKIPKFVNPLKQAMNTGSTSQKLVKPEDVFESARRGESKSLRIELKVDLDLEKRLEAVGDIDPGASSASAPQEDGGFGLLYPIEKPKDCGAKNDEKLSHESSEFVTSEQLAANRVSLGDQRLLPVFKNYHPGKPSCRLYIKNLAKQVEVKDLDIIYKKYTLQAQKDDDVASEYNIRLMQEGRMKGQAFVTLQNVQQAQRALDETNGYILKDKPIVVQFAKIASKPQTV